MSHMGSQSSEEDKHIPRFKNKVVIALIEICTMSQGRSLYRGRRKRNRDMKGREEIGSRGNASIWVREKEDRMGESH